MKAYSKHIDWGQLKITKDIMKGYVMPKYGKTDWRKDDLWTDIILDDVYDTFYRDEEQETEVAKESKDIALSIMKEKFVSMVESEKATVKDYTKLVVTDGMVDYVLEKYRNNWKCKDEIAYVILEDLWLKYGKDDKRKGKEVEHDHLKVNKDDKGKGKVHDIQNRLGKLEVDFARAIKARQVAKGKEGKGGKEVKEDKGDKGGKKANEAELKAKKAKEAMLAELKAKKAKKAKNAKKAKE
ncbi:hypothetical protein Tco_0105081 [Tanacetum coccineum]